MDLERRGRPGGGLLGADGQPIRRGSPEDGFTVPHAAQFASITSNGQGSYWHNQYDEAMRDSRENAVAMRHDAFLMALLYERKYATVSLRWHIEVDDDRDPVQKAVRDGLTRIIRRIHRFDTMTFYLLEAIWYGRYAAQLKWDWKTLDLPSLTDPRRKEKRKALTVTGHIPINGDKIGHHFDGTPYIMINPAFSSNLKNAEIQTTTSGAHGLYLRGSWRWRYIVHKHDVIDADYFDSPAADSIHGIGVRHVLYWLDWLRKEWLSDITDWVQRTGMGIRLWYYQGGNAKSREAVEKAAREQTDRTNLLIPRYAQNGNASEGVEFVDTSSTGADLLLRLQQHIEDVQERFVIGQSVSSGGGDEKWHGGMGRASIAKDTKQQIVAFDAGNLAETYTQDLVSVIQRWTYTEPEARDVDARFVFDVDQPEPEKVLNAVRTFVADLGGKVREDSVRSALGFDPPQEGDAVISLESIAAQRNAGDPQVQAGGVPVDADGDGQADGVVDGDEQPEQPEGDNFEGGQVITTAAQPANGGWLAVADDFLII